MEIIRIEKTNNTPSIYIDEANMLCRIVGASFPEDAYEVYQHVLDWLGRIKDQLDSKLVVEFDYDFLNRFIFSFDYSYYTYQNKELNQNNTYQLSNSSLQYRKEDSAWSFKFNAQNIFDVQFKNSNSFSSYIISDSKTYIMPRVLMFSIGYNL